MTCGWWLQDVGCDTDMVAVVPVHCQTVFAARLAANGVLNVY